MTKEDLSREALAEVRGRPVMDPSRRRFLKRTGLAVAGAAAAGREVSAAAGAGADGRVSRAGGEPEKDEAGAGGAGRLVDLVNLLQGTDSTPEFSRGNTLPIAAMPFGMAHWTIESAAGTPWMFHPGARRIQGFRCTHQLSPWLGDYGYASFLPVRGEVKLGAKARASSYRPEEARMSPHSLRLELLRYRAQVELVPTERCALLRATFEASERDGLPGLVIDVPGGAGAIEPGSDHRSLRFTSTVNQGGVPANFATYYVVEFGSAWSSLEVEVQGSGRLAVARFGAGQGVEARIGTSFISFEQAELNLRREVGKAGLEELREAGAVRWEECLRKVEIEGATAEQRRIFYSCMYRTLLFPRTWHEPDAQGAMHHFSAFNGRVMPGVMYADHGYWDVYRAWYPLMSILFPERLGEILQAWVNAYREGGWLPQFPAPGYRACMTGSLIDAVFGDAAAKGITGFDLAGAYEGLKKHATTPGDPAKGYGRVGIEPYLRLGYVPADRVAQSVAETVDAALGDFCIAQVAGALGKGEDAAMFTERAGNWRRVFDRETGFFRGRKEDGTWVGPFDPFTWGSPYVEGAAWQHRWDAPHDVEGLMEAMGGKAVAAKALEEMLTLPPIFHAGVYGQEIHEMSEMAAVPFGQYAHGNQPVHHVLYLFAASGRPERTQFWVRRVLRELYTAETFAGDEDTGSMGAWYLLSSMGFYPGCPGRAEYTLGSPAFARATLYLAEGKRFVVEAEGNGEGRVYARGVTLNGERHEGRTLTHAEVMAGGRLRMVMGETPAG